jgi:hypothetical protein
MGKKKATVTRSPSHLRREFILKFKAGGLVFEVPIRLAHPTVSIKWRQRLGRLIKKSLKLTSNGDV